MVFADGHEVATCRMYGSLAEIWAGFSKNLYEGIGAKRSTLVLVVLMYAGAFLVPYVVLGAGLTGPRELVVPGLVGVSANLLVRLLLTIRLAQPWEGVLLHPFAVLLFLGIAYRSYRWHVAGTVRWRGRAYAARAQRIQTASEGRP